MEFPQATGTEGAEPQPDSLNVVSSDYKGSSLAPIDSEIAVRLDGRRGLRASSVIFGAGVVVGLVSSLPLTAWMQGVHGGPGVDQVRHAAPDSMAHVAVPPAGADATARDAPPAAVRMPAPQDAVVAMVAAPAAPNPHALTRVKARKGRKPKVEIPPAPTPAAAAPRAETAPPPSYPVVEAARALIDREAAGELSNSLK